MARVTIRELTNAVYAATGQSTAIQLTSDTDATVDKLNMGYHLSGYIRLHTIGGAGTLDCTIQTSPDGTNWFDLITFTQLAAAGSEAVHAGEGVALLRYVRASWVKGGTLVGTLQVILSGVEPER